MTVRVRACAVCGLLGRTDVTQLLWAWVLKCLSWSACVRACVCGVSDRRTDVTQLLPSSTMAVDMVPNSVGEWMLHCHVSAHMMRGMIVTVRPPSLRAAGMRSVRARTQFVSSCAF